MSIWELTLLLGADLVLNYGARRQSDRILDTSHHDKGKWQVSGRFPFGTVFVSIPGSFFFGFAMILLAERTQPGAILARSR